MIRFLFLLVGIFVLILFYQKSLVHFRIFRLKKKIMDNPLIGIKEANNNYYYRQKGYTINYRIEESARGIKTVEWLSLKRKLTFLEQKILNIKRGLNNSFLYQRWWVILRPTIFFPLIATIIIFYLGIVQTQKAKVERLKWLIASVLRVAPSKIQYIGNGWLEISAQRKTVDKINEPVRYTVNPFAWFFSSQPGYVTRWRRGKPYGYVTHQIVYNDRGDVWINKEGTWRHGRAATDKTIEWDTPQGTGSGAVKVTGHDISTQDKKLLITDK